MLILFDIIAFIKLLSIIEVVENRNFKPIYLGTLIFSLQTLKKMRQMFLALTKFDSIHHLLYNSLYVTIVTTVSFTDLGQLNLVADRILLA